MSSIFVIVYPQPQHNVLAQRWNWNPSVENGPIVFTTEAQPHTPPKFWPTVFNRIRVDWFGSADNGPPAFTVEGEPHFVGKFRPQVFARMPAGGPPDVSASGPSPFLTEAQPHTPPKFWPTIFNRQPQPPTDVSASTVAQAETNVHFVPRFLAPVFARLPAFGPPDVSASGPSPFLVEAGQSFIARFQPHRFNILRGDFQNPDAPAGQTIVTLATVAWHWNTQAIAINAKTQITLATQSWLWGVQSIAINAKTQLTLAAQSWLWNTQNIVASIRGNVLLAAQSWLWTGRQMGATNPGQTGIINTLYPHGYP